MAKLAEASNNGTRCMGFDSFDGREDGKYISVGFILFKTPSFDRVWLNDFRHVTADKSVVSQ